MPRAMAFERFEDRDFWLDLAPGFHIEDEDVLRGMHRLSPDGAYIGAIDSRLKYDGYFQLQHRSGVDLDRMAALVRAVSDKGLSPVLCFLFDEFWVPFLALDRLYRGLLGDYRALPDFWIWNVDPKKGEAGWKPHRDKGFVSLQPDGSPKSLTTWIPLSRATPLNSCMYVVPAHCDPTYGTPRDKEWRFEHNAIRALPGEPGDVFVWTQAVVHWGGRSSPYAEESRVSMAFELQRADIVPFNQPLLPPGQPPSFDLRLRLVAKQILQYRHMYSLDPALEAWAKGLLAPAR
jgi:phytanoyl-CoA dioxygenase PhyH